MAYDIIIGRSEADRKKYGTLIIERDRKFLKVNISKISDLSLA